MSCLVLPYLVLSCPVLSYRALTCLVLSLSYFVLSLSCLCRAFVLSCLVLSWAPCETSLRHAKNRQPICFANASMHAAALVPTKETSQVWHDKAKTRQHTSQQKQETTQHNTPHHTATHKTKQGKARQDKTRQDKTRQGKARQGKTRQDKTRQVKGIGKHLGESIVIKSHWQEEPSG